MKLLEGRPRSYDRRMERASRGRTRAMKQQIVAALPPDRRVLEIGCGTGELGAMLAAAGHRVEGLDASRRMVEVARERAADPALEGRLTVRHLAVADMDQIAAGPHDAVVATLALSELSDDERRYALAQAARLLPPGGLLVVADEVLPRTAGGRLLHALVRLPLVAVTYLGSGATTRPLAHFDSALAEAGFVLDEEQRSHGDAFALYRAHRGPAAGEPDAP